MVGQTESQSPQFGSMFSTMFFLAIELVELMPQSPQFGSMFSTKWKQ
ncbi:hypothetical protein D1AOALGA4SA_11170 [Olavius algarvensis Delta 1 endosymbiont]|nr:hypothetical protein D1AOALGA4SA_11170 [Olavius algarvensis Delta 1 endosymbiont]